MPVRPIVVVLPPLVAHHVALVVELLLGQRRRADSPCDPTRATARSRGSSTAPSRSSWCDRCWWSRWRCRPLPAMYLKCILSATCAEPWNIMCSNRCAKPVLPGTSSREPTWYQRSTATTGTVWSSATRTVRPLSSLNWVKESSVAITGSAIISVPNDGVIKFATDVANARSSRRTSRAAPRRRRRARSSATSTNTSSGRSAPSAPSPSPPTTTSSAARSPSGSASSSRSRTSC